MFIRLLVVSKTFVVRRSPALIVRARGKSQKSAYCEDGGNILSNQPPRSNDDPNRTAAIKKAAQSGWRLRRTGAFQRVRRNSAACLRTRG